MSIILNKLIDQLYNYKKDLIKFKTQKVVIGIRYTAVLLNTGDLGLSYTLTNRIEDQKGYSILFKSEEPSKTPLIHLINYCTSEYSILRSIGVAAMNAYCQHYIQNSYDTKNDIRQFLNTDIKIKTGMVGNIKPISSFLTHCGCTVKILDKSSKKSNKSLLTFVDSYLDLLNVDQLIISGSALTHNNFDEIMRILRTVKGLKVFLGPSAQILPSFASQLGFSFLGSVKSRNPARILDIIMQGGGFQQFKHLTAKYLIPLT